MKITVDFDKTLTKPHVQEFIKLLKSKGVEIHILTYRYDSAHYYLYGDSYPETINNHDLWDLVEELGLHRNVIFTNCNPKSTYLNSIGNVVLHIDDDTRVMLDITNNSKTIPIQVRNSGYEKKVLKILGI